MEKTKNCWLIPTDKPSRLKSNKNVFDYSPAMMFIQEKDWKNQHIYITNDEEIKEGDWVFNFEYHYIVQYDSKKHDSKFWYKKIILTTDIDLIKDGVQAIDDEFLEWFVKNPSCESVEVKKICANCGDIDCIHAICSSHIAQKKGITYKIIIPKEEPKQELELKDFDNADILDVLNMGNVEYLGNGDIIYNPNLFFVKRGDKWFIKTEEPKQEIITSKKDAEVFFNEILNSSEPNDKLKKAAEEYSSISFSGRQDLYDGFIEGAKWQAERMYNDMQEYAEFCIECDRANLKPIIAKDWFEQFKKK